ncbi:MAG: 50S ribosomal protein L13 [Myxococcota bacterium]
MSEDQVERHWFIADARDKVLGRFASRVATILRGKHKPTFTPHVDGGDFVVVVNAKQVRLTGRKLDQKEYIRHSGYPGGLRTDSARFLLERHPDRVVRAAVKGMLPKGPLGRRMLSKLKVYPGAEHPHAAQQPKVLEITT